MSNDEHAVGVFKNDGALVGHIPIEPSCLIDHFMRTAEENFVSAMVIGPRKREVRLVLPTKFSDFTKDKRVVNILHEELLKIRTKYSHFEMKFDETKVVKLPYLK